MKTKYYADAYGADLNALAACIRKAFELANSDDENILSMHQKALRNMEISLAATALIYTLNFIDAMVDAHLYYFDVSDDLSLYWSPMLLPTPGGTSPSYGISVALSFK